MSHSLCYEQLLSPGLELTTLRQKSNLGNHLCANYNISESFQLVTDARIRTHDPETKKVSKL